MKTTVIAAFPGTGKSWAHLHCEALTLDSDSSAFSWESTGVRHSEWPTNYMTHIAKNCGMVEYIFVSSHSEVRAAMGAAGIPYVLVLPRREDKALYLARYEKRGSPQAFIDLLSKHWDTWLDGCAADAGADRIVVIDGHLASYLPELRNEEADRTAATKEGCG